MSRLKEFRRRGDIDRYGEVSHKGVKAIFEGGHRVDPPLSKKQQRSERRRGSQDTEEAFREMDLERASQESEGLKDYPPECPVEIFPGVDIHQDLPPPELQLGNPETIPPITHRGSAKVRAIMSAIGKLHF